MDFQMQGSNLVMYGFDPISGTLRPVGTTDSGQILFAGFANSGEEQDDNIADDYVIGNASGEQTIASTVAINTTVYSGEIKTNHATCLIVGAYLSSAVSGGNYRLGVQAVEKVTGQTNYRQLAFGTNPDWAAAAGWASAYAMVTRNDLTTGGNIHLCKTILPPLIRLSLTIPNNAGTTAGFWHYSLCR